MFENVEYITDYYHSLVQVLYSFFVFHKRMEILDFTHIGWIVVCHPYYKNGNKNQIEIGQPLGCLL